MCAPFCRHHSTALKCVPYLLFFLAKCTANLNQQFSDLDIPEQQYCLPHSNGSIYMDREPAGRRVMILASNFAGNSSQELSFIWITIANHA